MMLLWMLLLLLPVRCHGGVIIGFQNASFEFSNHMLLTCCVSPFKRYLATATTDPLKSP